MWDLRLGVVKASAPEHFAQIDTQYDQVIYHNLEARDRKKGCLFGKGALLLKNVHFPENSEIRENASSRVRRIQPLSQDSREFKDLRNSRDLKILETPPAKGPFFRNDPLLPVLRGSSREL